MSHIDTLNHSHVGNFNNTLPIYHPMEKDDEYGFDEHAIVIGGGSGEHPMFIIPDMNDCIRHYLCNAVESDDFVHFHSDFKCHWDIECSYKFYKNIKNRMDELGKFYDISLSVESFIICSIGEFLVMSGEFWAEQGLIDMALFKQAQELVKSPELVFFGNVVCFPVGYGTSGKIIKNNKVQWGYSFEDEKKDYYESLA